MLDVRTTVSDAHIPEAPPSPTHVAIRREDYRPPDWLVPEISLDFDLGTATMRVRATLSVERSGDHDRPLKLDGDEIELVSVLVDGQPADTRMDGPALVLDIAGARADTSRIVAEYDVRTPGIEVAAGALSGGNQQKLIVGREMSGNPVLLIAAHPTRGVDVGAQAAIWDHIKRARREGLGVLLISADLDELIGLSDTIEVILRGELVGEFDPRTVTPQDLGSAMTGGKGE